MQTQKGTDEAFLPGFWVGRHVGYPIEVPRVSMYRDYYLRKLFEYQLEAEPETKALFVNASLSAWALFTVRGCSQTMLRAVAYLLDRDVEWVKDNTTFADCLQLMMTALHVPKSQREQKPSTPGRIKAERDAPWDLARMIDFFGTYYRWTVDDVMSLSRYQIDAIILAVQASQEAQEAQSKKGGKGHRPITDARTKQDPSGVDSVMAFAVQKGVLKGKEG